MMFAHTNSNLQMPSLPAPALTPSRGVPGVALRIHSLKGRKLYGQIQESLYAVSVSAERPFEEREVIINNYREEVQAWYASSPLKGAFIPISDATVRRQVSTFTTANEISATDNLSVTRRPAVSPDDHGLVPALPFDTRNSFIVCRLFVRGSKHLSRPI